MPPLSDVHLQIKEATRRFADEAIRPVAEELDRDERFPAEIYQQMGELGLFGITVPEALGGAGMDVRADAIVMEELSRAYASIADQCGLVELAATLLSEHGTTVQQQRYLGPILQAHQRAAYCITESEAGSDVSGIKTTAERTPQGWKLQGSKLWIH